MTANVTTNKSLKTFLVGFKNNRYVSTVVTRMMKLSAKKGRVTKKTVRNKGLRDATETQAECQVNELIPFRGCKRREDGDDKILQNLQHTATILYLI